MAALQQAAASAKDAIGGDAPKSDGDGESRFSFQDKGLFPSLTVQQVSGCVTTGAKACDVTL